EWTAIQRRRQRQTVIFIQAFQASEAAQVSDMFVSRASGGVWRRWRRQSVQLNTAATAKGSLNVYAKQKGDREGARKLLILQVGTAGFEPAASCTSSKNLRTEDEFKVCF